MITSYIYPLFFALVEILNATMQQRDNGTNCLSQMCLTPTSNKFCLLCYAL